MYITILSIFIAACGPALLAYSVSPSATFLNQATAVIGWGIFLFTIQGKCAQVFWSEAFHLRRLPLLLALIILMLAALYAGCCGNLPFSLSLASFLMIFATLIAALTGMKVAYTRNRNKVFKIVATGFLISGLLTVAISVIQVFFPELADGRWIAVSALEGRATGNFRQPNHLGSLLLWSVVSAVALLELKRYEPYEVTPYGRPGANARAAVQTAGTASQGQKYQSVIPSVAWRAAMWIAISVLVLGIVLSASRTGAVGLLLLAAWGGLDRRLMRTARHGMLAAPLIYGAIWLGLTAWADASGHSFGGAARFSVQGDISSSRFGVWANTLALIAQHPWTGVGWGGFNFAWSLTPFPHRPVAFFDHTHNLILQLAVELGVPLATLVLGLLSWAFWQAGAAAWRESSGPQAVVLRSSWIMLLLVALHSQLEYPLWYAYFLLPTALIWGMCLGGGADDDGARLHLKPRRTASAGMACATGRGGFPVLGICALLVAAVGMASVVDYWRVVVIFAPPAGAAPLAERVRDGERSLLFSHHAYYAAATTSALPEDVARGAFRVTTHHLLDTRLMIAWAKALNAQGDVERARHLAARLREFHNPNSEAFFEPCGQPAVSPKTLPFQCTAPTKALDWRDFE